MTPGTSFAGTLPANGLTPCVPGMAWPGVLELGVAPDCAKDSVVPCRKTPASKSMQLGPKLSFTGASSTSHLVQVLCQGKVCYSCRRFRATRICAAHLDARGSKRNTVAVFKIADALFRTEKGTKKQTVSKIKGDTSPTSTTIDVFVRGKRLRSTSGLRSFPTGRQKTELWKRSEHLDPQMSLRTRLVGVTPRRRIHS